MAKNSHKLYPEQPKTIMAPIFKGSCKLKKLNRLGDLNGQTDKKDYYFISQDICDKALQTLNAVAVSQILIACLFSCVGQSFSMIGAGI